MLLSTNNGSAFCSLPNGIVSVNMLIPNLFFSQIIQDEGAWFSVFSFLSFSFSRFAIITIYILLCLPLHTACTSYLMSQDLSNSVLLFDVNSCDNCCSSLYAIGFMVSVYNVFVF